MLTPLHSADTLTLCGVIVAAVLTVAVCILAYRRLP